MADPNSDLPILVKHVALAVFKSGSVQGNVFARASSALNIARSRLVQYGFLKTGSERGGPENIKLTGKGFAAESKHKREGGAGRAKTREWDKIYALISEAEEEERDEGAMSETNGLTAATETPDRKKQSQVRRARVARRRTRRARVPRVRKAKRG